MSDNQDLECLYHAALAFARRLSRIPSAANDDADGLTFTPPATGQLFSPVLWEAAVLRPQDGSYMGFEKTTEKRLIVADPHDDLERATFLIKIVDYGAVEKGEKKPRRSTVGELQPRGDGVFIGACRYSAGRIITLRPAKHPAGGAILSVFDVGEPANDS